MISCSLANDPTIPSQRSSRAQTQASSVARSPELFPNVPTLDLSTLELLHHYSTSTYQTLVNGVSNREAWQYWYPQLAFGHEFLMHSLLGLSALHLADLQPQRRQELFIKASTHESLALPSFRSSLSDLNEQNCHAVFAFAGCIVPYTMASCRASYTPMPDMTSEGDLMPRWFKLMRGTHLLATQTSHWLEKGPFACYTRPKRFLIDLTRNPHDFRFAALIPLSISNHQPSSSQPEVEIELSICRTALDQLRRLASLPFTPDSGASFRAITFVWPCIVPQAFLNLIEQKHALALVILAHFCVLLAHEDSCWFYRGHAAQIVCSIYQALPMGEWREKVEWPMQQSGLHVPHNVDTTNFVHG